MAFENETRELPQQEIMFAVLFLALMIGWLVINSFTSSSSTQAIESKISTAQSQVQTEQKEDLASILDGQRHIIANQTQILAELQNRAHQKPLPSKEVK